MNNFKQKIKASEKFVQILWKILRFFQFQLLSATEIIFAEYTSPRSKNANRLRSKREKTFRDLTVFKALEKTLKQM